MSNHDGASSNGGIDGHHSCLNTVQVGNAFDLARHTRILIDSVQTSSEDVPHHGLNTGQGFDNLIFGSSVRRRPVLSSISTPEQFKEELFLSTLRNFILDKGGFLGEGWHVEFIPSPYEYGPNPSVLYCAPDGKRFESMYDVAHYLGISSGITPVEVDERTCGFASVRRPLASRRRRKDLARISANCKSTENHEILRINHREVPYPDADCRPQYYDANCASRAAESYMEENGFADSQNSSVSLPIQYKDFFVLRLGKVDARAAYHDSHQIWPIGYRSYWHDKVTGSLFQCEVSDGGDSGPVFKVRRCPCSLSIIPNGEIILLHNKANQLGPAENTESSSMVFDASSNEEEDILMLLSDPNPSEQDFLSCFPHDSSENLDQSSAQMYLQKPDSLTANLNRNSERSTDLSNKSSSLRDQIGEFYVEGKSSSSVWKMVSRTLIDACTEVYKQYGCLQFCCRHQCGSSFSDGDLKDVHRIGSLARFCYASGPIETPRVIQSDSELDATLRSLSTWLEQDRFGLDTGFVQEVIETLPTCRACSQYQFLIDRSDFLSSCTIGSRLLLAIQKNGKRAGEEVPYGLYSGSKVHNLPEDSPLADTRRAPPGRPLSSKIPGELVGDVFQIWEFFWRFYEILGLKEPLSFEELEDELIDPWPCDLNHLKKIEKKNQDCRAPASLATEKKNQDCREPASLGTENASCSVSLSTNASNSTMHEQGPSKLIPIETAATREATQVKVASHTYGSCSGVALTKAHISLLRVLVGELVNKVAVFLDPNFDARDVKPKRGRKKDVENSPAKEIKNELLTVNELTWPELARRYVLAVLSMNGRMEDVSNRESLKVYRCLQGDGGVLCGSLSGIAGMESDALLLAEAERQISSSTKQESDMLPVDHKDSDAADTCEPVVVKSNNLPEWAETLEPVRKLPTNVGTRIRKCVYNSLEKNPPEWAKVILEHSISKEVYKGNASGPTKKAVLSVLAKLTSCSQQQKPEKASRREKLLSVSDAIMKKCRFVLRSAVSADESKRFCNFLGTTLLNSCDSNDRGILGSPAMVSRPLDFRTIDLRLAVGAYCGSHEVFLEDVREVWHNLRTAYEDQPDLIQKLEQLAQSFESLYEKEILDVFQKFAIHSGVERLDAEIQKELHDVLLAGNEVPKAPWEDGVCKVCGIDKDDTSVLLCDKCDSEYHRYCLNPPLARIPDGDWFCPSCVADQRNVQDKSQCTQPVIRFQRRNLGDETRAFQEALHQLASSMELKEYWELNTEQRIFLLKFLCDEVLNSALIREHLEQCVDKSNTTQQKLYALSIDWRNLKFKEELLARTVPEHTGKYSGCEDFVGEEGIATTLANEGGLTEQQQHFRNNRVIYTTNFSGSPLKRASAPLEEYHEENGQTDVKQNFGQLLKSMIDKHVNGKRHQNDSDSIADGHVLNKATINENSFPTINVSNGNEPSEREHSTVPSVALPQRNAAVKEVVHGVDPENVQRTLIGVAKKAPYSSDAKDTLSMEENSGTGMSVGELIPSHSNTVVQGSHLDIPANLTDSDSSSLELNSLRNEISHLQDSIASLESQIMFTSLRRDFLGRDSIGRLYWVIGKPGKRPSLVVGGGRAVPLEKRIRSEIEATGSSSTSGFASPGSVLGENTSNFLSQSDSMSNSSPLVVYETDTEIQQLVSWLGDADPGERELKECILQWQSLAFYHENIYARIDPKPKSSIVEKVAPPCHLTTKAASILEKSYGPCLEPEVTENPKKRRRKGKVNSDEKMYRCECLEPVWPSRPHCVTCHQTFSSIQDFEGHNDGKCAPNIPVTDENKENDDSMKGKVIKHDNKKGKEHTDDVDTVETLKKGKFDISSNLVKFPNKACPYDLVEISKKFITNDSNKELIKEIGLIGSNGIPFLISSPHMFLDPPLLLRQSEKIDHLNKASHSSDNRLPIILHNEGTNVSHGVLGNKPRHDATLTQNCPVDSKRDRLAKTSSSYTTTGKRASCKAQGPKVIQSCAVPEPSLRPLLGKVSHILKRLKINLLEMEAALPEEALRLSRSDIRRRCAWRAFVKSAESIFEMIQATILLEGMIKAEYLKNRWWYWSSLTAAAKTSTISSLALRIYSLDDSIIYTREKDPQPCPLDPSAESLSSSNKMVGKKRKDMAGVGPS
ncbi:uncharacterized protein A4U43_C01F1810 [Asparagus officinalis]|uniref:PHD-type domain-containing protein n=1 Tax=Asparagus officinalis TaxID=4686 RepID=A0A5P1FNI3_ASPOF|nr:methyl-CpG-binding domain-containing protein 9-like [Asparagus officinalis]ONK78997.1 uncharacterized protein A4U43_C01F1810 [Asparagus officinalis]